VASFFNTSVPFQHIPRQRCSPAPLLMWCLLSGRPSRELVQLCSPRHSQCALSSPFLCCISLQRKVSLRVYQLV